MSNLVNETKISLYYVKNHGSPLICFIFCSNGCAKAPQEAAEGIVEISKSMAKNISAANDEKNEIMVAYLDPKAPEAANMATSPTSRYAPAAT